MTAAQIMELKWGAEIDRAMAAALGWSGFNGGDLREIWYAVKEYRRRKVAHHMGIYPHNFLPTVEICCPPLDIEGVPDLKRTGGMLLVFGKTIEYALCRAFLLGQALEDK